MFDFLLDLLYEEAGVREYPVPCEHVILMNTILGKEGRGGGDAINPKKLFSIPCLPIQRVFSAFQKVFSQYNLSYCDFQFTVQVIN